MQAELNFVVFFLVINIPNLIINNYRHTEEMIKQLENAGLGFFVPASESPEKLGKK